MTEDFSTPDTFGVRIGGLPVSVLEDMCSPELWHRVEAVRTAGARLARTAAGLSDRLHEEIGRAGPARAVLVGLRRAVHNGRPLTDRLWNPEVRAVLPDPLVAEVEEWRLLRAGLPVARAGLDELIDHQVRSQGALLRKAAADPGFQYGLALSSPVLLAEVRKWLARPNEPAPGRSLALRLVTYLARVTRKTSPFSTFTVSGLGTWDRVPARRAGPAVVTVAEANVWVVQQIVRALEGHPEFRDRRRLRLNPGAALVGDRWEFLGPQDDEEPLRSLRATAAVDVCVAAVREGRPTRGEAVSTIAERTGNGPVKAAAYLERLVELGLVEVERPFPDQCPDHVAALRGLLAGAHSPDLVAVDRELEALAEVVAGYPGLTDPADRPRAVETVDGCLRRIRDLLGPDRLMLPAKNSVIENALLAHPFPGPDRATWQPVLRDLDALRRCWAVLDPALPGRIALADLFAERIAAGGAVPFLAFHRMVQDWLRSDPELSALLSVGVHGYRAMHRHRLPRIRELAAVRDALCEEVGSARPDGDGVVRIAADRLLAVAGGGPGWMRAPDSVAFYGQPLDGPDGPGFVVNAVNSGHGRGRDRIRRLLTQAGAGALRDTVVESAAPPPGVVHADTRRHFGSNVGLRASAVALEIDCPEGASDSAADRRIRLGDLLVRHDPGRGLLVLHARGRSEEIRPVHPGLVAELWLPPALRLLMQSLGATSNLLIPGRRMFGDPSLDEVGRAGEVLAQPRVVVGSATVSRRQWVLPPGSVPTRAKGEGDRGLLLRLADWLAAHGIPRRCFVRALDPRSVVSGEVWRVKSRKPVYVDFANLLLVGVLERLLAAGPEQVVFLQEALPDAGLLPDHDGAGPRVTEYIVEINEGRTS
ncbi:lantibiotic dehydratase [Streptomyces sp. NPDC098789]|uniref:lantibiotic dehydratase n=1 Tax=Streptomyces sp. NPDC098789 TaxID=3366098 RepID=UPI0038153C96